ncbi:MAG: alpha/beta hydrolase [Nitrospirae bacterium]|nr:MAG: alpha/beta hydrolase [Nitrospirota bacterium]
MLFRDAITSLFPSDITLFQRWPVSYTQVEHCRLAYLDHGVGTPLVLLHGFGGSMWQWEHQQHSLSRHCRILTPDLPGSGLSEKPRIAYSPEYLVRAMQTFIHYLNLHPVTLIGHSMGAGLALALALTEPGRIARLVLIAGFPPRLLNSIASPLYAAFLRTSPPLWLARLGNRIAGRWLARRVLQEIIHQDRLITPLVVERSYRARVDPGFLPPLYSLMRHLEEWDTTYGLRLAEIQIPTLIIWGTHDRIFPLEVGKDLHALLSRSSFLVIPETGHMPQWESPDQVNAAILEFLQIREG